MSNKLQNKPAITDIAKLKIVLIREHQFFGNLLIRFPLLYSSDTKHVAWVEVQNNNLAIYYTDKLFQQNSLLEQLAILEHELMHIIYKHLFRLEKRDYHKIWNYAVDIQVNDVVENLPSWVVTREYAKYFFNTDLPDKSISEQLYSILLKAVENKNYLKPSIINNSDNKFSDVSDDNLFKEPLNFNNREEIGKRRAKQTKKAINDFLEHLKTTEFNHDKWNTQGFNKELLEYHVNKIVKETLEMSLKQGLSYNEIPAYDFIKNEYLTPKISWKEQFRKTIGTSIKFKMNFTRKRPNRKLSSLAHCHSSNFEYSLLPYAYAANKKEWLLKGVIIIDSSGSISTIQAQHFLNELRGVYSLTEDITVIICDDKVREIFKYKRNMTFNKLLGRGGTDFRPAFKKAEELKPDFIAYLTDGYGIFPKSSPNCSVLWCVTNAKFNPPFGKFAFFNMDYNGNQIYE